MNEISVVRSPLCQLRMADVVLVVCHGACPVGGADWLVDDWAKHYDIPCKPFPPDPRRGVNKFWARNYDMCNYVLTKALKANYKQSELGTNIKTRGILVAFPGGKGTNGTIKIAKEMGLVVWHPTTEGEPDWSSGSGDLI